MNILVQNFLEEFNAEVASTRKVVERIPANLYDWQPHEKSMKMGYLTVMLVDIPRWITTSIKEGVIDFGTFKQVTLTDTESTLAMFDKNVEDCKAALASISDEDLSKTFELRNQGQVLMSSTQQFNISSTINHWVHHRGQMTVYMRLNNIAVPSIYGPTADEKMF